MGRYFDENYDLLKDRLNQMASRLQMMLAQTIDALSRGDVKLAEDVIAQDEEVDRLELEIDELVLKLLALQQPMAIDLRFLITGLKINNDLERMADQAVNIAQGVLMLCQPPPSDYVADLNHMEETVTSMVRDCLRSFIDSDPALARQVIERDNICDDLNRKLIASIRDHVQLDPADTDRGISLLLITRNFERIGDLATNIAEDVVYYSEGRVVKHTTLEPSSRATSAA